MGGKNSSNNEAPAFPTTTLDSGGLFGTTTTSESGTTFKPTDFQKQLVSIAEPGATKSLAEYLNPDYNSEAFRAADDYYTGKMNSILQNNYLNPALANGLLRGSTAMDVARGFANDLAASEYERQQDYKNQQLQNFQAALLGYNNIYDIFKGNAGLSQSLANSLASYNMDKWAKENALKAQQGTGVGSLIGNLSPVGLSLANNLFSNRGSGGGIGGSSSSQLGSGGVNSSLTRADVMW